MRVGGSPARARARAALLTVGGFAAFTVAAPVDLGAVPAAAAPHQQREAVWEEISPPIALEAADFDNQNYGAQTIALSAADPSIVYLGTCYQGIWRTTDHGDTWVKVSTGENGKNLETGRNWTLAVDPTDPGTLYTVAGFGLQQGLWKSTNGGVDWTQLLSDDLAAATSPDVYSVTIDPDDPHHLLVGFHSGWGGGEASGVLESRDGGVSWTVHEPEPTWGSGHYVFFIDAATWLLTTHFDGVWRTADAGATWTKVSKANMQHGGNQLYRTTQGLLYIGAAHTLLRSDDEGRTWTPVGPRTHDGYNAVIGDGELLFAQPANTGANTLRDDPPYIVSSEQDGRAWRPFDGGAQIFENGPMSMVFDHESRVVYSSNWRAGVWRLLR